MAESDPVKAFPWAAANAPQYLDNVFASWVQTDGPAAMEALLSLPREHQLRQKLVGLASGWLQGGPAGHPAQFLEPSVLDALRYINVPPGGLR
jgi:hypothetical protein